MDRITHFEGLDSTTNYTSEGLALNLGNGSIRYKRYVLSNYDQGIPVIANSEFIEESE